MFSIAGKFLNYPLLNSYFPSTKKGAGTVPAPVKIVYRFLLFFGEELRTPFGATGEAGLTAT